MGFSHSYDQKKGLASTTSSKLKSKNEVFLMDLLVKQSSSAGGIIQGLYVWYLLCISVCASSVRSRRACFPSSRSFGGEVAGKDHKILRLVEVVIIELIELEEDLMEGDDDLMIEENRPVMGGSCSIIIDIKDKPLAIALTSVRVSVVKLRAVEFEGLGHFFHQIAQCWLSTFQCTGSIHAM